MHLGGQGSGGTLRWFVATLLALYKVLAPLSLTQPPLSLCVAAPQRLPNSHPQVDSTKAELAQQQKALADAQAAKAAAEQQLDRLTAHLDETEAQLQDAK